MANPEHLEILKSGVEKWNEWREENEDVTPNLIGAYLIGAYLSRANLRGAGLSGADLRNADLRRANLRGANLGGAGLSDADLRGADLSGADLREANLREAYLRGANLREAYLSGADLSGADLSGASLSDADLIGANLSDVNLSRANLSGANLSDADLSEADLIGADLSGANLREADLREADLIGAVFNRTITAFTDITDCKGLGTIKHKGPSPIEGRTTKLDYNNLPKKFLAGCGLNKWQIEAIRLNDPDLNENQITDIVYEVDRLRNRSPIQLNSLFISYSRKDEPFVEHIEQIFKDKDIRYWRDVHHMTAGPVEKQIDRAIRINETVLLILSEDSVNSDWVEWEISKARELEKNIKRYVICPVALDDSWENAPWSAVMMNQVKKYNILDFSNWKDKGFFQRQYAKLLKGLNIYYRNKVDL